jgi:heme/copper-type cytochrome/quinol oxidase subunit 2
MGILPDGDPDKWGLTEIKILLLNITTIALTVAGGVAVLFLIWGAFQYFTAYGDEQKAAKAKNTILWAIVGMVVIIIGRVIISEVWNLFGATPPNFS